MDTSADQPAGNSMTDMAELDEMLEPPQRESVDEMFLRLLKLVDLLYNEASPVEGNEGMVDFALQTGNAIVPLVRTLREQFDEQKARITKQDTAIGKLGDALAQKEIELKIAYAKMEEAAKSNSSQESSEDEEQHALNNLTLSTWIADQAVYKENVDNITRDAFQYGRFEPDTGNPNNLINNSENNQSRRPSFEAGMEAENQPSPDSSEASQPAINQFGRTSSEESLPQQAYDMTFPSSRGTFIRPGPVYERILAPRTKPMSTQKISSGGLLTAEEGDTTLCSQGSNDVIADKKGSSQNPATPWAENDSAHGFFAYIQGLQSTGPQPHESTPKFLQSRKYGKFIILDVLEWSLYTLLRAGGDLISGQLLAWWHLLLFLITTVLHLFASGTCSLDPFHLPKPLVFIVPRLSWCIIATQVMFFTCLMSFLAWRRELDLLLQANGLSRRYMLDYIYEESRLILFIGIDKGVFRLGTSEPENFWRSGNDTMNERIIGLTQ
ncbi:unnamed protein product [Clonostachys solani]|uniref:Uncharacterized protein n=1 Tax=Clonostachys solani TaxID=160281 RepID=A0A9N9YT03_9HYPO|nr:unnamed protein product [Clonostachys solani]